MHPDTLAVVEWMEGAKCSDELRAAIRKKVVDLVVGRWVRSFAKGPEVGGRCPTCTWSTAARRRRGRGERSGHGCNGGERTRQLRVAVDARFVQSRGALLRPLRRSVPEPCHSGTGRLLLCSCCAARMAGTPPILDRRICTGVHC